MVSAIVKGLLIVGTVAGGAYLLTRSSASTPQYTISAIFSPLSGSASANTPVEWQIVTDLPDGSPIQVSMYNTAKKVYVTGNQLTGGKAGYASSGTVSGGKAGGTIEVNNYWLASPGVGQTVELYGEGTAALEYRPKSKGQSFTVTP